MKQFLADLQMDTAVKVKISDCPSNCYYRWSTNAFALIYRSSVRPSK